MERKVQEVGTEGGDPGEVKSCCLMVRDRARKAKADLDLIWGGT